MRLPDDIKRVEPDDAVYLEAAAAEARYWQERSIGFLETVEALDPDNDIARYTNERLTGDPRTPWYATIARTGPYRRGLFLGTSGMAQDAYILETNPDLQVTICDISSGSLERWQRVLGEKFPGRVTTKTADLNFAEFEPDAYDLIVSSSTLHHVVNLEHVGEQINHALTAEGRFFLQDYVGESYFKFPEQKKRMFETLYNRDIARQKGRKPGVIWTNEDPERSSPFCGVRAGDILEVMASKLTEIDRRVAGTIFGLMLFAEPQDRGKPSTMSRVRNGVERRLRRRFSMLPKSGKIALLSEEYVQELRLVDSVLSDAGVFKPFDGFATYGKREN